MLRGDDKRSGVGVEIRKGEESKSCANTIYDIAWNENDQKIPRITMEKG